MGKKSRQHRQFLHEHPFCCFCGGGRKAATQDHIPPRSFFLGRKHPKGLEFPACLECNNASSNEEDIASLISKIQGTVSNKSLLKDFEERSESYIKTMIINKIRLTDTGLMAGGNHWLKTDDRTQEAIIMLSTKIVLALYYKVYEKTSIVPEQRIALTYLPENRITDEFTGVWPFPPKETHFRRKEISNQFYYRYVTWLKSAGKENEDGWDFSILVHLHRKVFFFAKVYRNESFVPPNEQIVRTCFGTPENLYYQRMLC